MMSTDTKFENTLERLLKEASESPAARPHFYRELMESQVLIIPHGPVEETPDTAGKTSSLSMLAITLEGANYIPFYLSEKFLPRGQRYLALPARTFLEITKGSLLVLNPGARFGKKFHPDEVARLLDGTFLQAEKEFQVQNSAPLLIGKPAKIPDKLLPELAKFFATEDRVMRAWLAWYHNPQAEKEPGYLLAIKTSRSVDFRALAGRASVVLKEVGTGGPYCDIVQFTGQGLTAYFCSDTPFYSKPLWTRISTGIFG